jgi:hypothetical protein
VPQATAVLHVGPVLPGATPGRRVSSSASAAAAAAPDTSSATRSGARTGASAGSLPNDGERALRLAAWRSSRLQGRLQLNDELRRLHAPERDVPLAARSWVGRLPPQAWRTHAIQPALQRY